jgi:hypothetical protein
MKHTPTPETPSSTTRRSVLRGSGAAALGISALALPLTAAASSAFGETPLVAAGSMGTPSELTASAGDTVVSLSWTSVSGAVAYQVQYRVLGSSNWLVDRLTDQTSLIVSGLTNGNTYEFRVIASDGTPSNVGDPTAAQSATPTLSAPGMPVGVSAAPGISGTLEVTWSAATTGGTVETYSLRYGTDGETWTTITGITDTNRTLTGLLNGTAYQVQVQAVNTAGDSDWTSSATSTPIASATTTVAEVEPQPPVTGVFTSPTSVSIQTDFNAAGNQTRVYTYATSTDGTTYSTETTATLAPESSGISVTGLTGPEHYVRVKKYESDGTTVVGTSTVTLERRSPTYTAGQVYTLTNATGSVRISTLRATVIGGSGGRGGPDGGRVGGQPSQPGEVEAIVSFGSGATITLAAGSGGAAGAFGGNGGAGGSNAFTGYAGGNGAADGPRGASGTGGGGGAASIVKVGTTTVIVAGGGGGGGGAEATAGDGADGSSTSAGGSGSTNGADGFVNVGSTDDAGGGGGGGGGADGGSRGGQLRTGTGSCGVFCTIYYYRSTPSNRGTNSVQSSIAFLTLKNDFASDRGDSVSGTVALDYLEVTSLVLA